MNWYVLKARQELRVRDELTDRGLFAYVPCERVKIRKGRNKVIDERPVWRGYVFLICADWEWPQALGVDGVQDFIRYARNGEMVPLPMALTALDPIIEAEAAGLLDLASQEGYEPQRGDRVRVKSGKWKGYLARVLSVAKRKVLLEPEKGLGRWEIKADQLEAAA